MDLISMSPLPTKFFYYFTVSVQVGKYLLQKMKLLKTDRSCGLTDKASDFYMISYPKIAGSSPATITSKINYGNVSMLALILHISEFFESVKRCWFEDKLRTNAQHNCLYKNILPKPLALRIAMTYE
ncbi:hypothetical protein OUZ56_010885 [Daphnia magna]|uniref:Uncharacterized protein n=1 Tax=Daphnia magna TaxID=35525 RepID=A0ABQ9YYV7_9CRUS|nr:hypothetical protein OUZ56_010885 [Daphnia magna]